jgi:CheY-like chemotaxis protein
MGRIAIIDDHEDTLEIVSLILQDTGHQIDGFSDARAFLSFCEPGSYDLIVLDIVMPGFSGFDVFREIQKRSPDLPVVALTANAMPAEREAVLSEGFCDYFSKPILDVDRFREAVLKHVGKCQNPPHPRYRFERPLVRQNAAIGEPLKIMELQVDLDTDGDLLLVVASGTMSFDATWQVLKQICDTALEKNLTRIIVDALQAQGVATTFDRYRLGVKLVTYCGEHKLWPRLAFIGKPPVVDGFGILVARNRGLDAERFPNWKEGLDWVRAASKRVA